jgi:nucleoside-diphosphate-sugar epimerase
MKALVTGGCGFIGSHLVKKLVSEGAQVTVVDDMSAGDLMNLHDKGVTVRSVIPSLINQFLQKKGHPADGEVLVVTADFVDPEVLQHFVEGAYTHVFHLAAQPRVEFCVEHPAVSTEINLMKTVELLSACRKAGVEKFVFASSSATYGHAESLPTLEEEPKNPTSPYGLQKLACEMFMQQFSNLYELDTVGLRFFNVYGPGCTGDNPYATAIAAWCDRLSKGMPLRSDGDGEQTRDMVYVTDVAMALCAAAKNSGQGFSYYNVATGSSISNNKILEMLKEQVGEFEVVHAPERKGDVKHTLASIDKIKNELGWSPIYTFKEGLADTLAWWNLTNVE